MISNKLYKTIVSNVPIACVDIMVYNKRKEVLLLKRAGEPLKDKWWVVGGRILKGEKVEKAAKRKVWEEAGLRIEKLVFLGYYEDKYKNGRHSISMVFKANVKGKEEVKMDSTSRAYRWSNTVLKRLKIGGLK